MWDLGFLPWLGSECLWVDDDCLQTTSVCGRGSAEAGGLVGGLVCSSYKLVMMLQSVWGRVDA